MRVAEVMDQVHDLHLQLMQEMGFIQEIDQALSKSLMVEFLRLKVIIRDEWNFVDMAGQHGGRHR